MTVPTYELKSLRDKILSVLLPYKVKRVAVFGSVVRGEDTPDSDLDILVTLPPPGERPPNIICRWGFGWHIHRPPASFQP